MVATGAHGGSGKRQMAECPPLTTTSRKAHHRR